MVMLAPLDDWYTLLGAVCERLRALVAEGNEVPEALCAGVIEAVADLRSLQASLVQEQAEREVTHDPGAPPALSQRPAG